MKKIRQCPGCAALGRENEDLRKQVEELRQRVQENAAAAMDDTLTLPRTRSLAPVPRRRGRRSVIG